jgi:hypothetical protein
MRDLGVNVRIVRGDWECLGLPDPTEQNRCLPPFYLRRRKIHPSKRSDFFKGFMIFKTF